MSNKRSSNNGLSNFIPSPVFITGDFFLGGVAFALVLNWRRYAGWVLCFSVSVPLSYILQVRFGTDTPRYFFFAAYLRQMVF